jgi:DsbC/DsbD-like thiol-disulfide interchange protein
MLLARYAAVLVLSVAAHCVQMSRAVAQPAPWQPPAVGSLSSARLIAPESAGQGPWRTGVEVRLAPSIITYWRNPGEAGVPPTFDFSRSTNVGHVEVLYPLPQRIHEGDIDAIGYVDKVVFPLRVTPATPGQAATLVLAFDYATCGKICVPAHADLTLALPAAGSVLDGAAIAAAEAATPRPLDAAAAAKAATLAAAADIDGRKSWTITPAAGLAATDLFVEAPEGFYVSTAREGAGFRAVVEDHPSGVPAPDSLRLTIAGAGGAVDLTAPLPR